MQEYEHALIRALLDEIDAFKAENRALKETIRAKEASK